MNHLNIISPLIFSALCFACGGSEEFSSAPIDNGFAGSGGAMAGSGGQANGGSSNGGQAGSSSGGMTQNGGSPNGGASGGFAGMANGGSMNGSGGTSGQCIPKTCFTLEVIEGAELCGPHDDGCGNFIDCGGCQNSQEACGQGNIKKRITSLPQNQWFDEGKSGVCGGGCGYVERRPEVCGSQWSYVYRCTFESVVWPQDELPPQEVIECKRYPSGGLGPDEPVEAWCCSTPRRVDLQ